MYTICKAHVNVEMHIERKLQEIVSERISVRPGVDNILKTEEN